MLPDRSLHEGSQNRLRETLGCDAVATQVSANPTGCYEAGVALQRCPQIKVRRAESLHPRDQPLDAAAFGKEMGLEKMALFSPGNS